MARIFITGSADGLGELAAGALIAQGHKVVLHARNHKRAQEALDKVPGAETVVTADLSSIDETKQLAATVNTIGKFDAIILDRQTAVSDWNWGPVFHQTL